MHIRPAKKCIKCIATHSLARAREGEPPARNAHTGGARAFQKLVVHVRVGGENARLRGVHALPSTAHAVDAIPKAHGGGKIGLETTLQVKKEVGEKRDARACVGEVLARARFGGVEVFALQMHLRARARGFRA